MLNQALLALTLGSLPGLPPDVAPNDRVCHPTPPEPELVDTSELEGTAADGTQTWGLSATYALSSGDIGEAFFVMSSDGTGEAYLAIDGDVVAHTELALDPTTGQPVTTTWWPVDIDASPELIAEMMRVDLPVVVVGMLPQEFKCSRFGRKVLKAGKYMWNGLLAAGGAACCMATQTIACPLCIAGATIGGMAGSDFADSYCE